MSEIQVGQINSTDGATAITTGADGYVSFAKTQIGGRRNLIINGAMQVAQRGTSSSSTGYQTVDRWRLNLGTQQEQKTDTPDQFKNSMEITGTVAGSSGYGIVLQRIESNNIYGALGQDCTLSCYVKNTGASTANVSVEVYRANSTDDFSAVTLVSSLTSQAITSGWTRITFPAFAVPTTASTGLEVRIFRYDASNDQEWLITGVQLEVGTVATPFEHRSYGEELALCHRYYFRMYPTANYSRYADGYWGNANVAAVNVYFPVPMRTDPGIDDTGSASDYILINGNTVSSLTSLPTFNMGTQTADGSCIFVTLTATSTGNGTSGNAAQLTSQAGGNWVGDFLGFEAEL